MSKWQMQPSLVPQKESKQAQIAFREGMLVFSVIVKMDLSLLCFFQTDPHANNPVPVSPL